MADSVTIRDGLSGIAATVTNGALDVNASVSISGVATEAKQDTMITHLAAIETAVEILDNAISGNEMQVNVLTIAAGDNNIGNVDIVTMPNVVIASGTVTTVSTVTSVTAIANALPAGTNAIGKLAANSGVDIGDVDVTSISAGTNLVGDVGIQPRTTNGLDTFMASGSDGSSILVATKQTIKASAGKLYGYYFYNPEAAVSFVHIYNTDTVTVGTTNPQMSFAIPAGSAANMISDIGFTFSTAMSCAATTTAGGNTAPATGVSALFFYK